MAKGLVKGCTDIESMFVQVQLRIEILKKYQKCTYSSKLLSDRHQIMEKQHTHNCDVIIWTNENKRFGIRTFFICWNKCIGVTSVWLSHFLMEINSNITQLYEKRQGHIQISRENCLTQRPTDKKTTECVRKRRKSLATTSKVNATTFPVCHQSITKTLIESDYTWHYCRPHDS